METKGKQSIDEQKRLSRAAYRWNAIGGVINALQSVLILMTITRVCDVATAGVFTLAYANGNLFLCVGNYGMRSFQASDRRAQYSFADYRATRFTTTFAMIATSGAYLAYLAIANDYSWEKSAVIGLLCLYEAVTSIEDVFHGNFQQYDRLDVASKLFAFRIASTIAVLCAVVVASKSLVVATVTATVYTALFLVGELIFVRKRYSLPVSDGVFTPRNIGKLLKTCFPLFAAAFLLFYIGNAPRYAIDALMDDASQAYYGYVAMPVFVVSLLAGFIYNPMVTSLADQWARSDVRTFVVRLAKVAVAVVGLTVACDLAALFAGVPVLDFLYRADTAPYLGDLLVLVTGGGFLALASLAVLGITIIRFQRSLAPAYAVVAFGAWAFSTPAVAAWGVDGAAWCYFGSMGALAVLLGVSFAVGVRVCRAVR